MYHNIINVKTFEEIDDLRNSSALTIEGLIPDQDTLTQYKTWLNCYGDFSEAPFYIIPGSLMNSYSNLSGSNAYPDKINIVCVNFDNIPKLNLIKLSLDRFQIGGRWLDDICDNNERRENI